MPNAKNESGGTCVTIRPVEPSARGARIHRLKGLFTNDTEAYEFLERVRADLEISEDAVILDLGELVHMTSGGVGMLAALYTSARAAGRPLLLAQPSPRLLTLLRVSGILPIIPSYDSIAEALRAIDVFAIAGAPPAIGGPGIESPLRRTGTE